MKKNSGESVEDVRKWFVTEVEKLWPAGLGSLSLRRSPCIRKGCHVCETGEKHASYVYYANRGGGQRYSVYVPGELAPQVEKALESGSRLKDVLYETSRRYIMALKRERDRRDLGSL